MHIRRCKDCGREIYYSGRRCISCRELADWRAKFIVKVSVLVSVLAGIVIYLQLTTGTPQ